MRLLLLTILVLILFSKSSSAQIYLEPLVGYQFDINKTNSKLFNTGIQLSLKRQKIEFLIQLQKSWTHKNGFGIDSSFTTNPNLPLYAPAQKTFNPSIFSAGVGTRVKLIGRHSKNSLFATWGFGVMYQKNTVSYSLDKVNYIVLNPDQTQHQTGFYVNAGLEYMRQLKIGRIFFNANVSSTPARSNNNRYPSYNLVAPLSFNIGYSIKLSNQ